MWFDSPVRLGEQVRLEGAYVEAYERRSQGYVVMEATATTPGGRTSSGTAESRSSATSPATSPALERRVSQAPGHRRGRAADARVVTPWGRALASATCWRPAEDHHAGAGERVLPHRGVREERPRRPRDRARQQPAHPDHPGAAAVRHPTQLLTRAFGEAFFTSGWLRAKFVQPVDVFDPLEASGVVTAVTETDAGTEYALDVWVRRGDGRLSTIGWATAALPRA